MSSIKDRHQQSAGNAEEQENKSSELQVSFYRGRKNSHIKKQHNPQLVFVISVTPLLFLLGVHWALCLHQACALQLEIKYII